MILSSLICSCLVTQPLDQSVMHISTVLFHIDIRFVVCCISPVPLNLCFQSVCTSMSDTLATSNTITASCIGTAMGIGRKVPLIIGTNDVGIVVFFLQYFCGDKAFGCIMASITSVQTHPIISAVSLVVVHFT